MTSKRGQGLAPSVAPNAAELGRPEHAPPGLLPLLIAGRYEVRRLLKDGGGVTTWLAEDIGLDAGSDAGTGSRSVVIKTTPVATLSTTAWLRLVHEATVISSLYPAASPGRVLVGKDAETAYLAQPYIDGRPLDELLTQRPDGVLTAGDTLFIASELLGTLQRMHERGIVHRDIKPSNVIVDPSSPPAWAVLIDFGLARSARLPASIRDLPVGTAQFIAPEQAGLIDADVDERADLYSLGALLYTCLAGHPPFPGDDAGEVLRAHVSCPVPSLAATAGPGRTIPRAADALVSRLLRKDPADRYQSASAALADVEEIRAAMEAGDDDPALLVGLQDRRSTLTEPAFVGRTEELCRLAAALAAVRSGKGGLVVVEAESGGGKTRLLEEVARRADQASLWILRGQGLDGSGARPFQMLDGVVAGILHAVAERGPQEAERLRRAVGDNAPAIAAALPDLAALLRLPGSGAGLGPEHYGEARSLAALPSLLTALGTPEHPALVIFDDCQWGDALTARLLARWQAQSALGSHLGVIVAFRSEEVDADHPLRALRPGQHLQLSPLDAGEIGGLVQSMAGPLPSPAIETVVRLAEGSPFMAAAILRGMVECGALVGSRDAWELDDVALRGVQASRRAAAFLLRRMDLLSAPVLQLLSVGAVLGKEFDLGLAIGLAGQDAAAAVPALAEARARRILWVDPEGNRCVFFHDKLREALLERMSPQDRAALHLEAAKHLEALDPNRVYDLAYHFDAGGAPERALPYALAAGAQARSQYALEVAETQYRIARRCAGPRSGATVEDRRAAAEGLGEVLSLRGSYAEAIEHLRDARSLATTATDRATLDWRLGEASFRCGKVTDALGELNEALRELDRRVPKSRIALVLAVLVELIVQAAHTAAPRLLTGRRPGPMPERESLAARIYSRLAYVHWFRSGRIPCAWAHLREMNMAERYAPGPELAQAYSEHAPVMTMIPWYARGKRYAERSLAIRTELGDRWGEGQSLSFIGVVRYAASDFAGCIESCQHAIRLLDRTGDRWEANTAAWHVALATLRQGDLRRAAELAEETYRKAMEIGDQAAAGISLSIWSRATGGEVPASLIAAEVAKGGADAHTGTELAVAEGVRLLNQGTPAEAVAALRRGAKVVADAGLRQEYVAPVQPWLATALRTQADSCGAFAPRERAALLRQARRAARRGVRMARHYRNNLPHALRERALTRMMSGRERAAERLIEESLSVAATQGAAYEHAQSLIARGHMGTGGGWAEASESLSRGEAELAALQSAGPEPRGPESTPGDGASGLQPTLSLVDRFAGVLEVGRAIAAASSLPAVRAAARAAALRLLRAEAATFVSVAGDPSAGDVVLTVNAAGGPPPPVSASLVQRAVDRARPVSDRMGSSAGSSGPQGLGSLRDQSGGSDGGGTSRTSLELAGIRSAICAPITVDGRVVECLYATHAQIGGHFGPEEERLASFIATLVGAALEHLAGTEARFRSLVQRASDVVTVVDTDGRIQYQSASLTAIFGYAGGDLLGSPVADWAHPDEAVELGGRIAELTAGGTTISSLSCRLREAGGTWRPVGITFTNLLDDPVVRGIVLNIRDLSDLRWHETHDSLTGLANRPLFTERLTEAMERQRRSRGETSSPAVLYIDIDDFKAVNDLLGHRAGDAVLAAVGKRLKALVAQGDLVARFGGDEFVLLLPAAVEGEPEALADKLLAQLCTPLVFANQEVRVEASLGIARPAAGQSASDVLSSAEAAMYGAKCDARGRYQVFDPGMRSAALVRSTLKAELSGALDREEFVLHYQPIVDLQTGGVAGVEPLLRWRHPHRGLLAPGEFIEIAEASNQMFELGAWVLKEACVQTANFPTGWAGSGRGHVSVNVSGRQVEDPRLVAAVQAALDASGLDPWRLVLEITETAMVRDSESILGQLNRLKALGIRFAVDDFGTGYSSLRYLHKLPIDMIKIDKAFIDAIDTSSEVESLASTIVRLGQTMGFITVAEGVESAAQAQRLRELGCQLGQGYHFSYPLDLAALTAFLTPAPSAA